MADRNQTASAVTAIQNPAAEAMTEEAFSNVLNQNITDTFARTFKVHQQGKAFFRTKSVKTSQGRTQTWRDMDGTVPQNRDVDDLPVHNWGEGFNWSWFTQTYRDSIAFARKLKEIDTEGVISGKQERLSKKMFRTTEFAMADVINRGVDDGVMTAGAPILAADGMYWCDSARPNPNPSGATWSNLESPGAITEASLFQAKLNADQQVDENGNLFPTEIVKVWIRPNEGLTLFRLNKSDLRVGTAQNDVNWVKGRWPIEEYKYMTTSQIVYQLVDPKSDDNELLWYVRQNPSFIAWVDGSNPDLMRQRVRAAFGVALGDPRKAWRGGIVT